MAWVGAAVALLLAACANDCLPGTVNTGGTNFGAPVQCIPQQSSGITYDCCAASTWYVCPDAASYGRCTSTPSDTTGCVLHAGPCPADSNQ